MTGTRMTSRLGGMLPGKRAFCWCFASRTPPEISLTQVIIDSKFNYYDAMQDHNGGVALKPMDLAAPMPTDEQELNNMFAELVDELGLDKPHKEAMFNLPAEKKWQIYCSKKKEQQDPSSVARPDYYIERISAMENGGYKTQSEEETQSRTKLAESLKTALRTQPMSFVLRFIELQGLQTLLQFLCRMDPGTSSSAIHTSVIGCIKAFMNNSQGRAHFLAHNNAINTIAQSLSSSNVRAKVAVLEILGAVCLVPGGHRKVLQAMLHFQTFAGERARFQTLVNDLDRSTGEYRNELGLKTAIMSFINAALKYGAGQKHLEFRLHLRLELLMLGIQPVLEKLRSHDNATLDRHIDFFEMVRTEDEKALAKKFEGNHVDSKSGSAMFELLRKKLQFTSSYQHFLSVLFHLLQLPFGNSMALVQYWQLLDRVVQQVALQTRDGDPDCAPLDIDVKKIVKQLANENEIKDVQSKFKDIQKENDDLNTKLAKKERECEIKNEEREELMTTLNKIKTKLEKECVAHCDAKQRLFEMNNQLQEIQKLVEVEKTERMKLELLIQNGSIPDDAKLGISATHNALESTHKHLLGSIHSNHVMTSSSAALILTPPPVPPTLPGINGGPPPPPPLLPGATGAPPLSSLAPPGTVLKRKNIPKPTQALKSFNWVKLSDNKIKETLWKDIDESKMYKTLDLEEFEKSFSAYQRQDGSENDIFNKIGGGLNSNNSKVKELSVIDGRRAQNCTILLSKLKMSNAEMAKAVLSMDAQEDLPRDMCEQLLKYVPSAEETQLLDEHNHEIEQMAKADRFLFEMSRIDHYEQRLKALYYKKKFNERMAEVKPKVEAVYEASRELTKSRKFKKLLELILALGNYMNRGNRGNASGFKVSSLSKIIDTKSSINRKITLLHYILEVVEKQFPELLHLDTELSHVRSACKVNMTELDAELAVLRSGLREIDTELAYHKNKPNVNGTSRDKFVTVMSDFTSIAAYNFSELEDQLVDMKTKFESTVKLYGEDVTNVQPDEFFGMFDSFLNSFQEAQVENVRFRKLKEEEANRALLEEKLKAEKQRRAQQLHILNHSSSGKEDKGEFDDLISALRTGDVFGEDMAKLKRVNKRPRAVQKAATVDGGRERAGKFN